MNTNLHINNQAELEALIERYFEGETSILEEQAMRAVLADCPWNSEIIDEARVVMGYFAAHSWHQRRLASKGYRQRAIGIAATIALVLTVGGYALWHQLGQTGNVCVAYVNGHVVQNDDQVMAMIASDMNLIDNAADGMTEQLSSLGEALEIDNE